VHLLTKEAFILYERHVKTNGIIAVHVSNRSLNLEPVIMNVARHFNYEAATIDFDASRSKPWVRDSVWMLLSHNGKIINSPGIRQAARPPQTNPASIPLWTDDFASLFQILHWQTVRMESAFSQAQNKTAYDLCQQGDFAGAAASYRLALRTHPDSPDLLNNLAWLLATCPDATARNGPEAVQLAEKACSLTHYHAIALVGTLAAAYAEAGRFDDAMATAEKACAMASESGEQDLLKRNQELLVWYRVHQPYREAIEKLVPAAP